MDKQPKERLDILLVNNHLASSREQAKAFIMAGQVYVEDQREDKPGAKFATDVNIILKQNQKPYASRGGYKLEKALQSFPISLNNKVALDIGASTGGFTDCMLQNGAKKVYAIDVGYGQLAWELRQDSRVITMEKTNIRYVQPEDIPEKADFASIDVSFISLTKVLPAVKHLLKDNGEIVSLIKPQFEAGREKVGKKGVVKDPKIHKQVILNIINFVHSQGLFVYQLDYSPIKGPKGNIEYLLYIGLTPLVSKSDLNIDDCKDQVQQIVQMAHENLK
ncbi:MAG: TlyA family RNA methyltransferase [Epulopiscium sp.]|nr:TlyA family RNA methyltransferase [Candidatus Epulonipiscium sp.]